MVEVYFSPTCRIEENNCVWHTVTCPADTLLVYEQRKRKPWYTIVNLYDQWHKRPFPALLKTTLPSAKMKNKIPPFCLTFPITKQEALSMQWILGTGLLLLFLYFVNTFFRIGFQWNCIAQYVAAWVNMQILYDYNNSSWYEVWENQLKVSRGTDGPAGLFWWVTMAMWIWPYLCLIFLLPPHPPTTPHQILSLIT